MTTLIPSPDSRKYSIDVASIDPGNTPEAGDCSGQTGLTILEKLRIWGVSVVREASMTVKHSLPGEATAVTSLKGAWGRACEGRSGTRDALVACRLWRGTDPKLYRTGTLCVLPAENFPSSVSKRKKLQL